MKIGLRLHDAGVSSFDKTLRVVRENGFECGHLALSRFFPDFIEKIKMPDFSDYINEQFNDNNLELAVLGCYFNIASDFDLYAAHLQFAGWLSPITVGTETWDKSMDFNTFLKKLSDIVSIAERHHVTLSVEPVCSHIVNDAKKAKEMLDLIQSSYLRIIYDPVNLLNEDNYKNAQQIFYDTQNILYDYIDVVHIKDYSLLKGQLKQTGAGLGEMDYKIVASFIKEKPGLYVTLEETTPKTAELSHRIIKEAVEAA